MNHYREWAIVGGLNQLGYSRLNIARYFGIPEGQVDQIVARYQRPHDLTVDAAPVQDAACVPQTRV